MIVPTRLFQTTNFGEKNYKLLRFLVNDTQEDYKNLTNNLATTMLRECVCINGFFTQIYSDFHFNRAVKLYKIRNGA